MHKLQVTEIADMLFTYHFWPMYLNI